MFNNKFTEEDKKKIIEFMNFVAKKAEFTCNTGEIIEYFKLLNYMQTTILKKIDANIFEIVGINQNPPIIPEE